MNKRTYVALGTLALIAASGVTAPMALADDAGIDGAAAEAEWERNLEARLEEDAKAIAAGAMSAALQLDLAARLALEDTRSSYQVLALARD